MTRKTESEALFERFCVQHHLVWTPIPAGPGKTPDYKLQFQDHTILVEIEQIESRTGFEPGRVSSRTVGSHVRHKISEARGQMKVASEGGLPAILLIHNTVDPWQVFGTEDHDFVCGMYGELTVRLTNGRASDSFHGRNAKIRHDANTSFSGVGQLKRFGDGAEVKIFENVYATYSLPYQLLPACIEVVRVEVEHAA